MVLKSDIRGAEYRVKAQQALDAAEGAGLAQVRVRHETAAAVWQGLADFEDRRSESARTAEAKLLAAQAQA
jgi:hypothetical protein